MAIANPENGSARGLTAYLDTVRIGAYFGLLYLLVRPAIYRGGADLWQAVRVVAVVLYLIFDSAVRRQNRDVIAEQAMRKGLPTEPLPAISALLLLVEIAGVGMFALWAVGFVQWRFPFTSHQLVGFGAFSTLSAVHNAIHIAISPNVRLGRYFQVAVLDDSLDFEHVSGAWIDGLRRGENRLSGMIKHSIHRIAAQDRVLWQAFLLPTKCLTLTVARTLSHCVLQFAALHVLFFNLMLGMALVWHDESTAMIGKLEGILPAWSWIGVLLGLFAVYLGVSCFELWRKGAYDGKASAGSTTRCWPEKSLQVTGNIMLLILPVAVLRQWGIGTAVNFLLTGQILLLVLVIVGLSLRRRDSVSPIGHGYHGWSTNHG